MISTIHKGYLPGAIGRIVELHGWERVYLDTFEGLQAARHLYEKFGFRFVRQEAGTQWASRVNEQRFKLEL